MRNIVSIISGFVLILGLSGCASASPKSANSPVRLTPAMFIGYEFTQISDKDGVDYTIFDGRANFRCGVVGFTFDWEIKDGNTLVFTEGSSFLPAGAGPESPERYAYSFQFRSFDETNVVTMAGDRFRRSQFRLPP